MPNRSQTPSGRAELLSWINKLTHSLYPRVEDLADGILYAQAIEVSIFAADVGAPSEDSISQLFERVDMAPETVDGNLRNMHVVQDMLRSKVIPKKFALEINVQRLAEGKLQDHMKLLSHLHKLFLACTEQGRGVPTRALHYDPRQRRHEVATHPPHQRKRTSSLTPRMKAALEPRTTPALWTGGGDPAEDEYNPQQYHPHTHASSAVHEDHLMKHFKGTDAYAPPLPGSREDDRAYDEGKQNRMQGNTIDEGQLATVVSAIEDIEAGLYARLQQQSEMLVRLEKLADQRDRMFLTLHTVEGITDQEYMRVCEEGQQYVVPSEEGKHPIIASCQLHRELQEVFRRYEHVFQ